MNFQTRLFFDLYAAHCIYYKYCRVPHQPAGRSNPHGYTIVEEH